MRRFESNVNADVGSPETVVPKRPCLVDANVATVLVATYMGINDSNVNTNTVSPETVATSETNNAATVPVATHFPVHV